MEIDHYKTLELSKNCTEDEIKQSYKRLALLFHPDKNPNNVEQSQEKFVKIKEAYEILSDPTKRRDYDSPKPPHIVDMNSMISNMFKNMNININTGFNFQYQPEELSIKIQIPIEISYLGKDVTIPLLRKAKCDKCKGSGSIDCENYDCAQCKGKGIIVTRQGPFIRQVTCYSCYGACKRHGFIPCQVCNGMKTVNQNIDLPIKIPKGCLEGEIVIVSNEGNYVPESDSNTNIRIQINDNNNEHYIKRSTSLNLKTKLTIKISDALCGFEKDIQHLDGRPIKVKSDEIYRHGMSIIIKGEGMKRENGENGDLEVEVELQWPSSILCKDVIRDVLDVNTN